MASGVTLRAQTFKMPVTGICADGAKIVDEKGHICCVNTPNSGYLAYTGYQKFNNFEVFNSYNSNNHNNYVIKKMQILSKFY